MTGVALAERWAAAGVVPSVVVGHSVGELAAAVATGRLGLADGLALACARGRAMQAGPSGGAMAAVYAGASVAADAVSEAEASGSVGRRGGLGGRRQRAVAVGRLGTRGGPWSRSRRCWPRGA